MTIVATKLHFESRLDDFDLLSRSQLYEKSKVSSFTYLLISQDFDDIFSNAVATC